MNALLTLSRRLVLGGSGLIFPGIALAALFAPHFVARQYGLTVEGPDALNQFRAVFIGFWCGLGALMLTAARRTDLPLLGDLCGVLLVCQALGRLLSLGLDGMPDLRFVGAMVLELSSGIVVLAARPTPTLKPE